MRAVFLDRDGVLNRKIPDGEYVTAPEELVMIPGAAEAVRCLNEKGWLVLLVTNQRGIARGKFTEADLALVHKKLQDELQAVGAHLDGIYVCPHEKDCCDCRKPKPGLLLQAREDFPQIDFEQSAMIGDSESDMEAGRAAGCGQCIYVANNDASAEAKALIDAVKLLLF